MCEWGLALKGRHVCVIQWLWIGGCYVGMSVHIRLYVLRTMTSKPPNQRLKIYLIHMPCHRQPYRGQNIWFQPAVLLLSWGCWQENKIKLVFGALSLQGSYLHFYWSKFKKLHEIWKGFFNAVNLRPTATFSLDSFRSYGSIKATIKLAQIGSWRKKTLLTCGHKNSAVF